MMDKYDFIENDQTSKAMIGLAIDFIDSNVLGRISIDRGFLSTGISSVIVERHRFFDGSIELTSEGEEEYPEEFSPEFIRDQMDLGTIRAVNVNRPRPTIVDVEMEDE
jgi:hypothetical protein